MAYLKENGVVVGNVEKKYDSSNPIHRYLMNRFFTAFDGFVAQSGATRAFEAGCGEGHLAARLAAMGVQVRASDFSSEIISKANALHAGPDVDFCVRSVYDLEPSDSAPLIVCCEVLEHLEEPDKALERLQSLDGEWYIISVPREPLWCVLNMVRGKYLGSWGNTPGHIQHWGKGAFLNMLGRYFEVVDVKSPLPWTMALCRKKC